MHDICSIAAEFLDPGALRRQVIGSVPDRDGAYRVKLPGHSEFSPERVQVLGHDPEEAGAKQQRTHPTSAVLRLRFARQDVALCH
jgi:hypothetical protein